MAKGYSHLRPFHFSHAFASLVCLMCGILPLTLSWCVGHSGRGTLGPEGQITTLRNEKWKRVDRRNRFVMVYDNELVRE
jgi:hypothetical protein